MNNPQKQVLEGLSRSPLRQLKDCFDSIGIAYKERSEDGYTYISMCNPADISKPLSLISDRFIEFDEDEQLASY